MLTSLEELSTSLEFLDSLQPRKFTTTTKPRVTTTTSQQSAAAASWCDSHCQ